MFNIKIPELAGVQVNSARGLVGEAYAARTGIIGSRLFTIFDYVSLKAGEETPVPLNLGDFPQNANVSAFELKLEAGDEFDAVPPDPTSKVTIKQGEGPEMAVSVTADAPTRPRNVSIRLEQGEPFWSFGDTLSKDSYELPDIARQVNDYLDKAPADASSVTLQFLVKSDTAGRVRLRVNKNVFTRMRTQSWKNDLDQTFRVDRNLQLVFGQRYELPLDVLPGSSRPVTIRMDIGGTFGPERMLGTVRPHGAHDFAMVSSDYALAQGLVLEQGMKAVGVAGAFGSDVDAELYIELQPDESGSPASAAPLAKANLKLAAPVPGAPDWAYAPLGEPVDLAPGTPYWIVVKGVQGDVRLGVEPVTDSYLKHLAVNRGGKLWKAFDRRADATVSRLRLVYLPEPDNQSAAIRVGVNEASWQSVDPGTTPAAATFNLGSPGAASPTTVIVEAQAMGTATLVNLVQEY